MFTARAHTWEEGVKTKNKGGNAEAGLTNSGQTNGC